MKRNRVMFIAIGVAVLGVLGFVAYQQLAAPTIAAPMSTPKAKSNDASVSASGNVVPKSASDLAFRTGGRVAEVLVSEGDQVKRGQPLMRLQDDQLKAAIEQVQAALDLAKANLAQVEQGARSEEIAGAEAARRAAQAQVSASVANRDRLTGGATDAAIASAQAQLASALLDQKLAQDTLDKLPDFVHGTPEEQLRYRVNATNKGAAAAQQALAEAMSGATQQVKAAQSNVAAASAQRDIAQARLDQLRNGATQAQIDIAKAGVTQAQAALNAAQTALDEGTLKAPFDGTIALINVDAGQVIGLGLPVASIADLQSWEVETDDLSEVDVVNVQPGQSVSITFDALPNVALNGIVTSITPRSTTKRGDVTYTAKIKIEQPDSRLRWGMTAQVDVNTK